MPHGRFSDAPWTPRFYTDCHVIFRGAHIPDARPENPNLKGKEYVKNVMARPYRCFNCLRIHAITWKPP